METESLLYITLAVAFITALLVMWLLIMQISARRAPKVDIEEQLRLGRIESQGSAKSLREEMATGLKQTSDTVFNTLDRLGKNLITQVEGITKQIRELQDTNQNKLDEIRKEGGDALKTNTESTASVLQGLGKTQQDKLDAVETQLKELVESTQGSLDRIRKTLDERVKDLQEGNEKKLEEMRQTVDEKLHKTLEDRLGASFKLVSDQLQTVHQGLGEMQTLAAGVGDLKKVLSNVKVRGTWAEVQLGGILEQVLLPNQYERNVRVNPDSNERVEFAVKTPSSKGDDTSVLWLPVDSKFPQEDYLRLQEAAETADPMLVEAAEKELLKTIRNDAKAICSKYICPPHTTDYAIMFLATEGLYAEVIRHPTFVDELFQNHRVFVAGPMTLAAILCSFRAGHQTVAIERRASEVWQVLGAVKTEFGKFGDVLAAVKRQLTTASNTIDKTGVRTRAMERHLRAIEEVPDAEAARLLSFSPPELGDPDWDGNGQPAGDEPIDEPPNLFMHEG